MRSGAKSGFVPALAAFLAASALVFQPSAALAAGEFDLTDYRKVLKEPAAKLLGSGKMDEAVAAIQAEIVKNPKKSEYQRLLASALRRQGKFIESIEPLQARLKARPEDGVAALYLAEAQVRSSRIADAQATVQGAIASHPGTVIADVAMMMSAQLASGNTIEPLDPPASAIKPKKFLETSAAKLFEAKDYAGAASAFEAMAAQNPRDVMVLRYWGASLTKAGHAADALPVFERASKLDPLGIALHEDWGSALKKLKLKEDAEKHLSYAKVYDPAGPYAKKADKKLKKEKKKKGPLKWKGGFGYTYDVNIKKRSNVAEQRKAADIEGGIWHYNLGATLNLYAKDDWLIKADGSLKHNYRDSARDESNKNVHIVGVSVARKTKLFGKPVDIAVRNGGTHNAKHGVYNGLSYKNTVKLAWDWNEHYEPSVTNNISYSEKDDTGTRPEFTNKEGWSEEVSLDHKFIPDPKLKDYFYTAGTGYRHDFSLGDNNVLNKVSFDAGLGLPVAPKLTSEFTVGYAISQYPEFSFPARTRQKRGDDWTLKAAFVREINDHWEIEFDYTYLNFNNRNDRSQYDGHLYALVGNFKY
jgi:Flp pilus assembly protein TadD